MIVKNSSPLYWNDPKLTLLANENNVKIEKESNKVLFYQYISET